MRFSASLLLASVLLMLGSLQACSPTVQVAAPSEPITINMNIKIEHEIRVKVDQELDDLFDDEEIF
ncbi:MAG: YnbE family lipoprotein [Pseudomonadales bacterium]|nr:YnbE family lipoprotein [Pseudomonadales bacterium]